MDLAGGLQTMSHDIFISYSIKDRLKADAVCHRLENEKIRCWYAPRDISPGGSWAGEIADAIPHCKIMLLIFSKNSNASKQVLREVEIAISNDVTIIPLKIEDVKPTGGMIYYLSTTHWIDAIGNIFDERLISLTKKIKTMIEFEEEPAKGSASGSISETVTPIPEISSSSTDAKGDLKKQKKTPKSKKWLYTVIPISIILIAAVFYLALINWSDIFKAESAEIINPNTPIPSEAPPPSETPLPSENSDSSETAAPSQIPDLFSLGFMGYNPDEVVVFQDKVIKTIIFDILSEMGEPAVGNEITVRDMFKLKALSIFPENDETKSTLIKDIYQESQIYEIHTETLKDLSWLKYAKKLKALSINGYSSLDLEPIGELNSLSLLILNRNHITNVESISNLFNLNILSLNENNISEINSLNKLVYLGSLNIGNNPGIDISGAGNLMYRLWDLNLSGNTDLVLTAIKDATRLRFLNLSNIGNVDLDNLINLEMIRNLDLSNNLISDITSLKYLTNLQQINISNNPLGDISALKDLSNLEELIIDSNVYENNLDTVNILLNQGSTVVKTEEMD